MDGRVAFMREHRLIWAVGLSLLLHLIFLLFFSKQGRIILFQLPREGVERVERRIAFEIIETPEENRSLAPPEDAQLLSDKNALARDLEKRDLMDEDLPYSDGVFETKMIPRAGERPSEERLAGEDGKSEKKPSEREAYSDYRLQGSGKASEFSRELLLGGNATSHTSSPQPAYKQKESSAKDVGGISFNTYAWDFAPYLLELKRRIEKNIYPPPVFTHLGFGGKNILRFRIHPDGRLEGPLILGYEGQKALVRTSQNAIRVSAPFRSLPKDFPEKFLEVTATFRYVIM